MEAEEFPCMGIRKLKWRYDVEPMAGIEPATYGLRYRCSTN